MKSMWVSLLGTQQGEVDLEHQTKGLPLWSCAISHIIQALNIHVIFFYFREREFKQGRETKEEREILKQDLSSRL